MDHKPKCKTQNYETSRRKCRKVSRLVVQQRILDTTTKV